MAVLAMLGLIFYAGFSHSYENLCRRDLTIVSQSSTYKKNTADLAKDGNVATTEMFCAHTAINYSKAWFQVDFGQPFSIFSVKIYYRKEDNWKPYRFRQFYLDVSNSSADQTTSQRTRCYKDNTTYPNVPNNTIVISCQHSSRYVIVETTYDAQEDDKDGIHAAILEICEIEVYGQSCSTNCLHNSCDNNAHCTAGCIDGYWGETCEKTCPLNCKDRSCNRYDGHCVSCKLYYWGSNCTFVCSNNCFEQTCNIQSGFCNHGCTEGRYGEMCQEICSPGCAGRTCEQTGTCMNGCIQNWAGARCNICDSSHYGYYCAYTCSSNCNETTCNSDSGMCTFGCKTGFFGEKCNSDCSSCPAECDRTTGVCKGNCEVGKFGEFCNKTCVEACKNGCNRFNGMCNSCTVGFFGQLCNNVCSNCQAECDKNTGECRGSCKIGKFGNFCNKSCNNGCLSGCFRETGICNSCLVNKYGEYCNETCSRGCFSGCDRKNGSCSCSSGWQGEKCDEPQELSNTADFPATEVGAGMGALLFVVVTIIVVVLLLLRTRRNKTSKSSSSVLYQKSDSDQDKSKGYTNIGSITVAIEDPDEEPQIEKPEECVYYNNLSVAKDVSVSDLLNIITTKQAKENEGFLKEFKSLPYGERFPCEVAKSEGNITKNRFKTTFPYDHSRVVLESSKGFTSDYINANYIENLDGKREFIASQGPRANTVVDHWRMIWQEHVNYIVMLTNLIEGPKVKCHQYWPEVGKEMDVDPFSLSLLEENVYAYFVVRKLAVRKNKVTGSRTVVQFHYTRWPDHGTPDPLNLVDFLRQFRHKIKPSHHPILVHCSAGIGRTGTFIALDVLSRYGKVKGKINVIEYVKAMRKDRMTMIQNVDQYIFLYHALYEFFRRSGQFVRKDNFLSEFANLNKAETKKQLSDEFNELTSLKTKYEAKDYKSGKKHQKLNASKSVLPVEKYLVYLTSHIAGRETYYNAVNVSSFTKAEELISAQFPVAGAAIDLVRLLIDEDCSFLVCLNPMSEVKELKDWVNDKIKTITLEPYEITKHAQTGLSPDIRKTSLKIKGKEDDILDVEILECLSWSSSQTVPADKSILIDFIKQFCLDRKSHPDGRVAVLSKDGASCCGVFCAVYNAVQQIQQDGEVDLFTIVRQLQVRRPEMISTVEEYEFCYDAVHQFLASDSVYANT